MTNSEAYSFNLYMQNYLVFIEIIVNLAENFDKPISLCLIHTLLELIQPIASKSSLFIYGDYIVHEEAIVFLDLPKFH